MANWEAPEIIHSTIDPDALIKTEKNFWQGFKRDAAAISERSAREIAQDLIDVSAGSREIGTPSSAPSSSPTSLEG